MYKTFPLHANAQKTIYYIKLWRIDTNVYIFETYIKFPNSLLLLFSILFISDLKNTSSKYINVSHIVIII